MSAKVGAVAQWASGAPALAVDWRRPAGSCGRGRCHHSPNCEPQGSHLGAHSLRKCDAHRPGCQLSLPLRPSNPQTGAIVGFDVDLAGALGEELGGIQPQFLNVGFDGLYDSLLAGRFDAIISALPVDYTWTEDVHYSPAYFEAGLLLVTRRDLAGQIGGAEDLAGHSVAIEWGSEADAFGRQLARRLNGMSLQSLPTPARCPGGGRRRQGQMGLSWMRSLCLSGFAGPLGAGHRRAAPDPGELCRRREEDQSVARQECGSGAWPAEERRHARRSVAQVAVNRRYRGIRWDCMSTS